MVYSAYKLNKQDNNIQSWHTSFPILNQSIVPFPVLTCFLTCIKVSQEVGEVVWDGIPISLRIFQSVVIHTVKGFSVASEAEIDVFLEFSCFSYDPADVGNLISGLSAFSKPSFYIWKFSVHILLKTSLKDFKHYLASIWNECNGMVVWTFFGIALLWDRNEYWPYPALWPLLSFPNLLAYWV